MNAAIGVQHTEVPNLGASWSRFLAVTLLMVECCYRGPTQRGAKSGCKLVTLFDSYSYDGLSAVIGVQYTEVPNMGASWSRFLAVTLMMV